MKESEKFSGTLSIGILDSFGATNLGDLATQQAMIQNLRRFHPEAKIYGFSLHPEDTEKRFNITSFPISRIAETDEWKLGRNPNYLTLELYKFYCKLMNVDNPLLKVFLRPILFLWALVFEFFAVIKAYKNVGLLDILIISGGGQLDDYWGGARAHPYTLFLWANLARLRRVKLAFVSVGAGPIKSDLSKYFIKNALSKAFYRSYRDEDSKKYIERVVGFKRNDPVYPDLAHSLQLEKYFKSSHQRTNQPIVGINPMPPLDPSKGYDELSHMNYLNKLFIFTSWLLERKYRVSFYPGCIGQDIPAIKQLKNMLESNGVFYSKEQIIEEQINSVDELMLHLSTIDIVVASRFHGVLLPLLSCKPTLAISYHPKIDMLMKDIGQSEYCLGINDFDVEALKEKFVDLQANFESVKEQLCKKTQEYKTDLNQQYEYLFRNLRT